MAEFMKTMYPAYSRRATQVCIMSQALERIAAGDADAVGIAKAALETANPFDWKSRSAKRTNTVMPAEQTPSSPQKLFRHLLNGDRFRYKAEGPVFVRDKSGFMPVGSEPGARRWFPADMNAEVFPEPEIQATN